MVDSTISSLFIALYNSADFTYIYTNRRHIEGDNIDVGLIPLGVHEMDVFPLIIYATTSNVWKTTLKTSSVSWLQEKYESSYRVFFLKWMKVVLYF